LSHGQTADVEFNNGERSLHDYPITLDAIDAHATADADDRKSGHSSSGSAAGAQDRVTNDAPTSSSILGMPPDFRLENLRDFSASSIQQLPDYVPSENGEDTFRSHF